MNAQSVTKASVTLVCYSIIDFFFRVWEQLLKIPGNEVCCDCGEEQPRWASINLGITLCIGEYFFFHLDMFRFM